MKREYKSTAAAVAAIVCAASLSGCVDNGYLMTVDGMDIRNGIYLQSEISAYNKAYTQISSEKTEAGETSEVEDVFAETVDGKPASEWIKEQALEDIKRYVAINRLGESKGIELSDEEISEVNTQLAQMWDEENVYAQYIYGTKTIGEHYESIGVSRESMKENLLTEVISENLFLKYYDTDGETPVSDADIDAYLKENYASVMMVELPYETYQGIATTEEAIINTIKDTANEYANRINNGESFVEIKHDFDLLNAQNEARVAAEDEYAERTENGEILAFDTFVQSEVDKVTVEKAESEAAVTNVFSMESSPFDADITDYIWTMADDGVAKVFDNTDSVCVIVRTDVTKNDEWKSSNRVSVLNEMKSDEYEQLLKDAYANYEVVINDRLVNNKYAPEKIKGLD